MGPYKCLEDVREGNDLCNCALAEAKEAHQWALEATHILEEKIEWLSQSATRIRSTSHQFSHSHGYSRRWPRGHLRGHTKTLAGGDHAGTPSLISCQENQRGRCFPSPSPTWLRRQDQQGESLSEEDPTEEHMGQASGRGEAVECDLGIPAYPGAQVGVFSGGPIPT